MDNRIYVIGHVNPDTDTIAAATGYAWLLRERDGADVVAARAGATNPQTTWILKHLGLDAPLLLTDASPRFQVVTHRLDTTTPDSPLRDAWAITSRTGGVAPIVNEDGTPFGLLTGISLFDFLSRLVGPHPHRQEMRIAEILDQPCREACDRNAPRFQSNTRIRDVINHISHNHRARPSRCRPVRALGFHTQRTTRRRGNRLMGTPSHSGGVGPGDA